MATRSVISRKTESGSYLGIYCHYDGYPSHNGRILLDHYSDEAKVIQLIDLGSLSVLAPKCNLPEGRDHSFDSPVKGYTIAYARDRDESWEQCRPKHIRPFREDYGHEFEYLWQNGQWYVSAKDFSIGKFNYVFPLQTVFEFCEKEGFSVDNPDVIRHLGSKSIVNVVDKILH